MKTSELPRWKKWLLTTLLVAAVILGAVVWSDSRATAILSKASLDQARRLAG